MLANDIFPDSNELILPFILEQYFNLSSQQIYQFKTVQQVLSLPLENFLQGTIFSLTPYTKSEQKEIISDLINILTEQLKNRLPSSTPFYYATAGAPGCGKSFFVEANFVNKSPCNAMHIDVDRVCLANLRGYKLDCEDGELAYEKWRDASNFVANFMLIFAIAQKYNIVHAVTSTNSNIVNLYHCLSYNQYIIHLHVLFAPQALRIKALDYRAQIQEFVQVSAHDIYGKVWPVFERLLDTYLKADQVKFYFHTGNYWQGQGLLTHFATYHKAFNARVIINNEQSQCMELFSSLIKEELTPEQVTLVEQALQKNWTSSYTHYPHQFLAPSSINAIVATQDLAILIPEVSSAEDSQLTSINKCP